MGQAQHQPLFENPKQGKLRTKVENGECVCSLRGGARLTSEIVQCLCVEENFLSSC